MNIHLIAGLLGIVEGLTEFLPVSSTAHLRIIEKLFSIELQSPYWKMFTIVIQLGAILALPFCFWERLRGFIRTFPYGERGDRTIFTHPVGMVMLAFLATAVPAFIVQKKIDANLENLTVIGTSLVVGGVLMWLVDTRCRSPRIQRIEDLDVGRAVIIGLVQTLAAIFPGTSRSMCTIAAGQVTGLTRPAALEFSFFVSIPTMIVATGYSLLKATRAPIDGTPKLVMTFHEETALAVGFLVSFLVAVLVVKWFTAWVRRSGFTAFAIYRLVVGSLVLLMVWKRGW